MYDPADILEAARTIRPFLSELLGADAERMDQQLAELLAQADTGQPIGNRILALLATQEPTREWMQGFLKAKQPEELRAWRRLPGQGSIVGAAKFVCPEGDYIWYRPRVGVEPPLCPTHQVPLVQV